MTSRLSLEYLGLLSVALVLGYYTFNSGVAIVAASALQENWVAMVCSVAGFLSLLVIGYFWVGKD